MTNATDRAMNHAPSRMSAPLPIFELSQTFTSALLDAATANLLIKAPTGSGKSTQIPQFVLDSGVLAEGKCCIVLQPRRIAARMLAQRVTRERNTKLGGEVGYQIRFENVTSRETRLTYVTEGVMLRMLLEDPQLDRVGCIVIDEFHERHLDGDLVLAFARRLQRTHRPDLKIIVMSATLVPGPLVDFMQPCRLLESQGRTFPVEIRYQAPVPQKNGNPEPIWDQAARACEALATLPGFSGDMLVFMPGGHEIRKTIATIQGRAFARGRRVVPLHGELTPQDQDAAVTPGEQPKIIVSTNVAETSLTIEGIKAVIDGGTARIANYDARRGINTLTVQKISRASAEQRAGRAGRLGPGIAVRLWPEREHLHRPECELPEVQRLDLSEALLALRVLFSDSQRKTGEWGQENQSQHSSTPILLPNSDLEWFEAPVPASLARAEGLLHDLGATDPNGRITEIGRQMAKFPLHPRFSRMLLAAAEFGCLREAALCAAIAQGRDILLVGQNNASHKNEEFWQKNDFSEFQALLRAFTRAEAMNFETDACARYGLHAMASREAARSEEQFLHLAKRAGLTINDEVAEGEALAKTLLAAFSDHLGVETSAGSRIYRLAGGYTGYLEKDAHIRAPRLLVAAEIIEVQGKALTVKLNNVTAIDEAWLREMFPADFTTGRTARYDSVNRRVMSMEETRFRSLMLANKERGEADETQAASLLAAEVIAGRLELPLWNEKVEQWITRLNCLSKWMPELEIPAISETDRHLIIEQLCHGCTTYRQLKDREVFPALHAWLSHIQREMLEKYAPERYALKNGRTARIEYSEKQSPCVSVVLQQMYDIHENPKVAAGRVNVTVHLLSPAQRPIQTTADLGRFWREGYPAVKAQLRGRYPKHEWR